MGRHIEGRNIGKDTKLRWVDVEITNCNFKNSEGEVQPEPKSLVCYKADTTCHESGDGGDPTYLYDKINDEPLCVYSIYYFYYNSVGCSTGKVSVHAKLSYFPLPDLALDRRYCGNEICIPMLQECDPNDTKAKCCSELFCEVKGPIEAHRCLPHWFD
ncbi:uncharacterized protein LOC142338650 [Convolutriloba macropyga]|uniref:uncharacterized protein LOC142338650 n=1 Tax=Convolutriloba macropyga TaxID=536237 RepID=UPI003F51DE08